MNLFLRRSATGLLLSLCLGCASREPSPPTLETYVETLAKLQAERGGEREIRLLTLDGKDLDGYLELLEDWKHPTVLAETANALKSSDHESGIPEKLDTVLAEWVALEPENGLPLVLQGERAITRGELPGGIDLYVRASRKQRIDSHLPELRRTLFELAKREGVHHTLLLGKILGKNHIDLSMSLTDAYRVLWAAGDEYFYREDLPNARRCFAAGLALGRRDRFRVSDTIENLVSILLRTAFCERMAILSLVEGDRKAAERYISEYRDAKIEHALQKKAFKRFMEEDPLGKLIQEIDLLGPFLGLFGLREPTEKEEEGDPWPSSLEGVMEDMKKKGKELESRIADRATELRPFFVRRIVRGELATNLELLSKDEKRVIASREIPMVSVLRRAPEFFSGGMTAAKREFLLRHLDPLEVRMTVPDVEASQALGDWATMAVVLGKDRAMEPALRDRMRKSRQKGEGSDGYFGEGHFAYLCHHVGADDPEVRKALQDSFSDYGFMPYVYRSLGKLGGKKSIELLMKAFKVQLEYSPSSPQFESIPVYFALRDATGIDLGFSYEPWAEWYDRNR